MDKAKRALALRLRGLTYAEIGRRLGVSRQRAQQLLARFRLKRAYRLPEGPGAKTKSTVEVPP